MTSTVTQIADHALEQTIVPPPSHPMGVAREIIKALYRDKRGLLLRCHSGEFFRWDGQCWPEADQRDVRAAAYEWLENVRYKNAEGNLVEFHPSRRKVDDLIDAMKAITIIDSSTRPPTWTTAETSTRFGLEPAALETIAMRNGLLHVPTRTLYSHTPDFFVHHALNFDFDEDAGEPERWLSFLSELWEDASSISTLQEVLGYILAGGTEQQKIFLMVGPKRGGKGTIGRVLTGLLGRHNVAAPTLSSLSTNFGLQPLIGKPLALISDARLGKKTDAGIVVERLLSVSGEDSLTIDRKYRDAWTGQLSSRFLILTNELPRLADASGALSSRFVLLVATRSFFGRENPALTNELLAEAPAIFNWALRGLDRLSERGYFEMPSSSREAIQQLEDLGSPISAFLRERCWMGPEAEVDVDEIWKAWKGWCEADNRHAGTKAMFGRDLRAAAPTLRRGRPRDGEDRAYRYLGIGLGGGNTVDRCQDHQDHPDHHPDQTARGPSGPRSTPLYPPHNGELF